MQYLHGAIKGSTVKWGMPVFGDSGNWPKS